MSSDFGLGEARYRVLADSRLHFSRLFFQVTAFNLALALAAWKIVVEGSQGGRWALALSGAILMGAAGVGSRIFHQERRYAAALAEMERASDASSPAFDHKPSVAHLLTLAALGVAGLVLTGTGFLRPA